MAMIALVIGAAALLLAPRLASSRDVGDVRAAAMAGIELNNRISEIEPGLRPGHLSQEQRQTLRDKIVREFSRYYAGNALTNRLTGMLAWADRLASQPTEGFLISYRLLRFELDVPIIVGDSATVTGSDEFIEQQGYMLPDGRIATYGGTYTEGFALELERRNGTWMIIGFTSQPLEFVPDPRLEANLDVDPAPGETKPPLPSDPVPMPILP